MPSTVVHCALAVLVGASLLGARFDRRAALVVIGITVVPDLDVFLGLVVTGAHRAALHTAFVPLAASALLLVDTRVRDVAWFRARGLGEQSRVRSRWGRSGVRLAWAAIAAYAIAGIGLDLVTRGVNVFWPLYDQFFLFSGRLELSTTDGVVQTFVERTDPAPADAAGGASDASGDGGGGGGGGGGGVDAGQFGSTKDVQVSSGVDPDPGATGVEPLAVERVFPIAQSGWELLLVVSALVVLARTELQARRDRDA